MSWFDVSPEEELLRLYVEANNLEIPLGFTRGVLSLIFKKSKHPVAMTEKVPENRFFFPIDTVWQQKGKIDHLLELLREKESILMDIQSSKRWRCITILTEPYRKVKEMFCGRETSQ